jgi:hypothetical protein
MSVLQVHYEFAKLVKEFALQGFRKEIANHFFSGAILDREFTGVNLVGDEIKATVELFAPLAA